MKKKFRCEILLKKIICLCSGGLDSFALVQFFKNLNYDIKILFLRYGQLSYLYEYEAVQKIGKALNINDIIKIDLQNFGKFFSNSLIIEDELGNDFFPGRNLILLSIAASIAYEKKIPEIGIGIINSVRIFPDCTNEFILKLEELFLATYNYHIGIQTPLECFSKIEVIKYLKKYNLPIQITYSCQKGVKNHCKKCPSCLERFNAIKSSSLY